jgi:hypothetical protein
LITIGIDPGWASFGIAMTKNNELIGIESYIPKTFENNRAFISNLDSWITKTMQVNRATVGDGVDVYIERFVTYGGIQVDPEKILMLIGALEYFLDSKYSSPILIKALDWKVRVCHHLVKTKGLSNPNKSFNKKYSLWAAEQLSGQKFKSDHEADAVCLSYMKPTVK